MAFVAGLLTGCTGGTQNAALESARGGAIQLGHVHGLDVDPANSRVYIASHHGLFAVANQQLRRVTDSRRDVMGFTVAGPNHFLASGHSGPADAQSPAPLGLIESIDAGTSWSPVAMHGRADLHVIEVAGNRIYAYDAISGSLLVNADGRRRSWARLGPLPVGDPAANPASPDELLVATTDGSLLRINADTTPQEVISGPSLALIEWANPRTMVGLTPAGSVFVSRDGAKSWRPSRHLGGVAQALDMSRHRWLEATSEGVYQSANQGRTWSAVLPQES